MPIPCAPATSGSRSDAESVKIATRVKGSSSRLDRERCGHDTGEVQPGERAATLWGDGPFAARRAGRHLHPALQHRPDRGDVQPLPGKPRQARRERGERRDRGTLRRAVLRVGAHPLADLRHPVRSARPSPGDVVRAGVRGRGGRPDRADREPADPRRHSAARGCVDALPASRRSSGSSPWRPPAARSCAARRPPASRARRWPGWASGFIVAPKLFEAIGPAAFFLNAGVYGDLIPDLSVRRLGPGRASERPSRRPTSGSAGIST